MGKNVLTVTVVVVLSSLLLGATGCDRKSGRSAVSLRQGWAVIDLAKSPYAPQRYSDDKTLAEKLTNADWREKCVGELERQLRLFAEKGVATDADPAFPGMQACRVARLSGPAAEELVEKGIVERIR